jgi:signal transduction histidine kinase
VDTPLAVKYSERNSLIRIYRGHVPPKFSDSIEISNVGIGIDKEDEKQIFNLVYKGESAKSIAFGQGKGLYIAKKIMEAQKGDIVLINNDDPTIFGLYFK